MALDGTYETKLLRMLIGYLHVSILQQVALVQYGKGFHLLTLEERTKLENELVQAVFHVAHQVSDEALSGTMKPPTVN